jgi:hypothetical protein
MTPATFDATLSCSDLLHVDGLALVDEARIAGDDEKPADAGERGDDLPDHAVREVFLLRIATHIGEGQHRDRRPVGQRQRRATLTRLTPLALGTLSRSAGEGGPRRVSVGVGEGCANPEDPHRAGNIFDLLLAQILKDKGQPVARTWS